MRKHYSLLLPPATPSSLSQTLDELFEMTWRPSRATDSPHVLLTELRTIKDNVRCTALVAEVHRTADVNLDCTFAENELFTPILDCEK